MTTELNDLFQDIRFDIWKRYDVSSILDICITITIRSIVSSTRVTASSSYSWSSRDHHAPSIISLIVTDIEATFSSTSNVLPSLLDSSTCKTTRRMALSHEHPNRTTHLHPCSTVATYVCIEFNIIRTILGFQEAVCGYGQQERYRDIQTSDG